MSGNNPNWPDMIPAGNIVTGLSGWSPEKYGHLVEPRVETKRKKSSTEEVTTKTNHSKTSAARDIKDYLVSNGVPHPHHIKDRGIIWWNAGSSTYPDKRQVTISKILVQLKAGKSIADVIKKFTVTFGEI